MKNFVRLLMLVSGLLAGYFVGDYRGSETRRALEEAVRMGQSLDRELQESHATLQAELSGVSRRHAEELASLRTEYARKSAEWQQTRQGLDATIHYQSTKLAAHNRMLDELLEQLGSTDGAERAGVEQKIAILRSDIDGLLRELNGNACLKTAVPHSVLDSLNGTRQMGSK